MGGEGRDAEPGGFKDYGNIVSVFLFPNSFFPSLKRERDYGAGRTVGDQILDIYSCGADDREGDRLLISCAGGAAAGSDG